MLFRLLFLSVLLILILGQPKTSLNVKSKTYFSDIKQLKKKLEKILEEAMEFIQITIPIENEGIDLDDLEKFGKELLKYDDEVIRIDRGQKKLYINGLKFTVEEYKEIIESKMNNTSLLRIDTSSILLKDPFGKRNISLERIFNEFPAILEQNNKYKEGNDGNNHPIFPHFDRISS